MDYQKHYDALIDRARHRQLTGYVERHHVVPKCLGGSDANENIVPLTPEEHFLAHQLLVKLFPHNKKIVYAAWGMTQGKWRSNKKFGWLRRLRSQVQIGVKHTPEARKKISDSKKGKKLTQEAKDKLFKACREAPRTEEWSGKISRSLSGKKKSQEHVQAIKSAREKVIYTDELRSKLAANKGKPLNEKQKAALLLANKGKQLTDEHKRKVSEANKGKVRRIVVCPHCGKEGGDGIMKRWHFENCKEKHV